jgi:uncharacterized protein (DUF849 family)
VIEVGLNEDVPRDRHPRVPVHADEVAADAVRCQDAGAAVVHWHARADDGGPAHDDADRYAAALRAVRSRRCDLLLYPTYSPAPSESPDERFAHVWRLHAACGLELAPLDLGSVNLAPWDAAAGRFAGDPVALGSRTVFQNSIGLIVATLARVRALGMVPAVTAFDLGFTRTMVHLVRAGHLAQPVYLKLFLYGDLVAGPFPSELAIDAHLAQIPDDVDVEWCAVPTHLHDPADVERLCRHALARGGGVRVGLGDNPGAYPHLANADLVELARGWAADAGRPVATSADLRVRLGLAPDA